MKQVQGEITVTAPRAGLYEITAEIAAWVAAQGIAGGLLTVFLRHTSASLAIQENVDPDVLRDLEDFFERIAPTTATYRHDAEGADDMPAHIRAALTQTHLAIPVVDGAPTLGTYQGIFLIEHRFRPRPRHLALHLLGD